MNKESYTIIGLMSGTSLDGIDLAYINFEIKNNHWIFKIIHSETIPYNKNWLTTLKNAVDYSSEKLNTLNIEYTKLLGNVINDFIEKNKIQNIDAIASHGHTILHQPHKGFTLQIGNLPQLAQYTNQTVVCDFRVQDVNLGGQGAPLVPIGDKLLFGNYKYCLNLGGFSNVSFNKNGNQFAFDISAVNTVLNFYANQLGLDYDNKGKLAKTGTINKELFDELNKLDFYQKTHPKSLGFEFVKEIILPLIERYSIDINDKLATFTEHIAFQTATALEYKNVSLFITGGGAYNEYLISRIQFYLPEMKIIIPEKKILEYKEALIFGLLGVLKLRDEINVLKSVTGASKDHSSGFVYSAK